MAQPNSTASFTSLPESSLPPDWYFREDILRLEREWIFKRKWQFAGFATDVEGPGDYFTCLLGGFIPIVVLRTDTGELRGFLNACRHRGHLVTEGCGTRSTLVCPYHGWTYDLDGSLRSAPRSSLEATFDHRRLGLIPVNVDVWNGFVFVNPDIDSSPLLEAMGPFADYVGTWGLDFPTLERTGATEFDFDANWKIVAENLIECYHCPTVHPGYAKFAELGIDKFELFGDGYALLERTTTRPDAVAPYQYGSDRLEHRFATLWPNVLFGTLPGPSNFFMFTWMPLNSRRTRAVFEYMFGEEASDEFRRDYTAFFDSIGAEDAPLVRSVQEGLESTMVPPTRLMVEGGERLVRRYQEHVFQAVTGRLSNSEIAL